MQRAWLPASASAAATGAATTAQIKVLSYNVLSQSLMRRELFPYASETALKWKQRSELLLREIALYDADIVCLQECDKYSKFWAPQMLQHGYEGVYSKRTGKKEDGCAVFFKAGRLEAVGDTTTVKYNDEAAAGRLRMFETDNIGQIVQLRLVNSHSVTITVANTHLFWRPAYNYLRLRQVHQLLAAIARLSAAPLHSSRTIICGDFNATPDDAIYELLVRGSISQEAQRTFHQACLPIFGEALDDPTAVQLTPEEQIADADNRVADLQALLASAPFTSAYGAYLDVDASGRHTKPAHYPEWSRNPPFSNFTDSYKGNLDYIFVTVNSGPGHVDPHGRGAQCADRPP